MSVLETVTCITDLTNPRRETAQVRARHRLLLPRASVVQKEETHMQESFRDGHPIAYELAWIVSLYVLADGFVIYCLFQAMTVD